MKLFPYQGDKYFKLPGPKTPEGRFIAINNINDTGGQSFLSWELQRHMKNCTINVTTADTGDDEMPPLGKGSSMGLLRMTLGQETEGGIMRTQMTLYIINQFWTLLNGGTQEVARPQHGQRTHPGAHELTPGWEKKRDLWQYNTTSSWRSWKEDEGSNFRPKPQRTSWEVSCRYNKTCLEEGICILLQPSPLSDAKIIALVIKGLHQSCVIQITLQTHTTEGVAVSGQVKLTIFFASCLVK